VTCCITSSRPDNRATLTMHEESAMLFLVDFHVDYPAIRVSR
jgi:hypothetical protein